MGIPQLTPSHLQRGTQKDVPPPILTLRKKLRGRRGLGISQVAQRFTNSGSIHGERVRCEDRWAGTWQNNDKEEKRLSSPLQAPQADSERQATGWDVDLNDPS